MLCTSGAITMAFTLFCDSEVEKFEPVHEITLRSACKLTVDVLEANPRFMGSGICCVKMQCHCIDYSLVHNRSGGFRGSSLEPPSRL